MVDDVAVRFIGVWVMAAAGALYCRAVFQAVGPGFVRVALVLPAVAFNLSAGSAFDAARSDRELLPGVMTACFTGWWLNMKLLAGALGRGQLEAAAVKRSPPFTWVAVALLPITVLDEGGRSQKEVVGTGPLVARFLTKAALLACGVAALSSPYVRDGPARNLLYAFSLYWLLGALMDGPGSLLSCATKLTVAPHFKEPYRSRSATEFWALRWNLVAGTILRDLFYAPIIEGSALARAPDSERSRPGPLRRAVAVSATFVASGLAHEAVMWYVTRAPVTGEWFAYFALQAPLLLLERAVKGATQARLPDPLAVVVALGIQLTLGELYFFPPVTRSGLDRRVVAALRHHVYAVLLR